MESEEIPMANLANLWQQLANNLTFVFTCILIIAALALLSRLGEKHLIRVRSVSGARRITIVALCAALAAVLHIMDFALPFLAPDFYKLDFSEVPVMLCGFYLGPTAAVLCEAVKILLKLIMKSTSTAFVGDFANFAVGCSLVLPAVFIYHLKKSRAGAIIGMIVGTLVMAVFGSAFNGIYLLPKFSQLFGLPMEVILGMGAKINGNIHSVTTFVVFAVAPLNLIKGAAVTVLTLLLYKRVARPLFGISK